MICRYLTEMIEFLKIESKDKKEDESEFQQIESVLIFKIIEYSIVSLLGVHHRNMCNAIKSLIQRYLNLNEIKVECNTDYPYAFDITYKPISREVNLHNVVVTVIINSNAVIT